MKYKYYKKRFMNKNNELVFKNINEKFIYNKN